VRQVDPTGAAEGEQDADALQWMEKRKAQQADWQRQITEAEQKVSGLQLKIADLEKRIRATRNPLLARPEVPDEEKDDWASKSAPERVKLSQEQLDQAKTELAEAQRELNHLRNNRP
jgi:predicted  nucleic acid-binding Zn-ribbon protein